MWKIDLVIHLITARPLLLLAGFRPPSDTRLFTFHAIYLRILNLTYWIVAATNK
jgi:hypothetical protein